MFETNPSLIQDGRSRHQKQESQSATPLVLIHDGGGTVFSYYLLDNLERAVFGIANPRFKSGKPWAGGLHEMASHYADLVASVVVSGSVILGGWSLGGMLSLETAHILAKDYPSVNVVGLVMIDSVCPVPPPTGWGPRGERLVDRQIEWPATTKQEVRDSVERCFREAHRMAREWSPPAVWQTVDNAARQVSVSAGEGGTRQAGPPPVVLLRSRDVVPTPDGGLLSVDLYREERNLGWDNFRPGLFRRVLDIPGNHFSVFDINRLDRISDMVKLACRTVEEEPAAVSLEAR